MAKQLRDMTDDELTKHRSDLNEAKIAIKAQERAADDEIAVRQALRGLPANVKRIILEGRVEVSGDVASSN